MAPTDPDAAPDPAAPDPAIPDPGPPGDAAEATRLLGRAAAGGKAEGRAVFLMLQDQLRALAGRAMADERGEHTLQASALVHEAWLKLFAGGEVSVENRQHFLRLAAGVMRQVLIDHARARRRDKRGGGRGREDWSVALSGAPQPGPGDDTRLDLLQLDEALQALEQESPRQAQVVQLRYFAGLEVTEVARALDVSESTVAREWRFARAWLLKRMGG